MEINNLLTNVQWEPFGPAKSWLWQMGASTQAHDRVYDLSGRLVRYRLGANIRDISYDSTNRISAYTHYEASTGAAQSSLDQTFAYDELSRLTSISASATSWSMGYDANGNRTSVSLNGNARAYTTASSSNRLTNLTNPAISFTYDAAGNITTGTAGAAYRATYSLENRLATMKVGAVTTTYSYDAMGQRFRKVGKQASSTVIFVYDQSGHLLGEYDSAGTALREFVWLGDEPIAVFTPDGTNASNPPNVFYIHSDHLGAPRVIVNTSNQIRWRWMAEPFATTAPETNPSGLGAFAFNLRLPGQYADAETGLFYNYRRDYDPALGRYVQSDPIGLAGRSAATYAYANGQATRYSDPMGLWSTEAHNYFIDEFVRDAMPDLAGQYGFIDAIKAGSRFADSGQFQSNQFSYMHAMSSAVWSKDKAKEMMCKYVSAYLGEYRRLRNSRYSGYWGDAYRALGMALHAVMDSTSPLHRGFQYWPSTDAIHHGAVDWSPTSEESRRHAKAYRRETINLMKRALNGDLSACGCEN